MDQRSRKAGEKFSPNLTDVTEERLAQLRDVFPEAFGEDGIDFDKLRAALGDELDDRRERYAFSWAGKAEAIRVLQAPSHATLVPARDQSIDFDATQHVFIEGENLETLKLLRKAYAGQVKMIYIDPPYNTGNDFIYPDDYSDPLDHYLRLTGQSDEAGNLLTSNPETSGRYHSAWLSMMYPRLFLARQLLRDDGVIFVSIDDHEVHNLRLLMNEIFGEENFVAEIAWKNVYGGGAKSKHVVQQHEYVLLYARAKEVLGELTLPPDPASRKRYTERDDKQEIRGPYFTQPLATTSMDARPNLRYPIMWKNEEIWPDKQWQWSRERTEVALANDELVIRRESGKWSVRYKQYLRDEHGEERTAKLFSILQGPWSQEGTADIVDLFGDPKTFTFPKPVRLVQHFISCAWADDDALILDFFAGSAVTAHAVLQLNQSLRLHQRFLLVQLPEPTPIDSPAHGLGFGNIADLGIERIRRVVGEFHEKRSEQLDLQEGDHADLGLRVFKLARSNWRQWRSIDPESPEQLIDQMGLFVDPLVDAWQPEAVLWEVAIKEGYALHAQVEQLDDFAQNAVYRVTDPDKHQSFLICLDEEVQEATARALPLTSDDLFICRDVALTDTLAANLALQCRLKTI